MMLMLVGMRCLVSLYNRKEIDHVIAKLLVMFDIWGFLNMGYADMLEEFSTGFYVQYCMLFWVIPICLYLLCGLQGFPEEDGADWAVDGYADQETDVAVSVQFFQVLCNGF
jgi:hypothetical protein